MKMKPALDQKYQKPKTIAFIISAISILMPLSAEAICLFGPCSFGECVRDAADKAKTNAMFYILQIQCRKEFCSDYSYEVQKAEKLKMFTTKDDYMDQVQRIRNEEQKRLLSSSNRFERLEGSHSFINTSPSFKRKIEDLCYAPSLNSIPDCCLSGEPKNNRNVVKENTNVFYSVLENCREGYRSKVQKVYDDKTCH